MTECLGQLDLSFLHGKRIDAGFDRGGISSDGGLTLIAAADKRLGLTEKLSECLVDERDASRIVHPLAALVMQRVYQIVGGYEDCNDADQLRHDPILKLCVGRLPGTERALASQPTLSRFENSVGRQRLWAMADVFLEIFISQYADTEPEQIILDFDATDDETHGQQQFAEFHGYYDEHCYLPLIVTAQVDGGPHELLVAMLRKGKCHSGYRSLPVLKLLVARLRAQWPDAQIILRADSGFALPRVYNWCERNNVDYLLGLAQNSRLLEAAAPAMAVAREQFAQTGEKVRNVCEEMYAAGSWPHQRRVVIKAEVMEQGENPRFVVTSLSGEPEALDNLYGERGDMENRIRELKRDLAMDRTSCHRFLANQFRVLLHAAAFVLLSFLRKHLADTSLCNAQACSLRLKLLKIGVRVQESHRRMRLDFASSYPLQELWMRLLERIKPVPSPVAA